MRLVIDGFGKFLGVKGETLVVKETSGTLQRISPQNLEQVIISGKGSVSTDALQLLAKNGVNVLIVDFRGDMMAVLMPPMMKTVSTRKEQYFAYRDKRGLVIAREIVRAKIKNQKAVLYTLAKRRVDTNPILAERLYSATEEIEKLLNDLATIEGEKIEDGRENLLNIEGRAAQQYWGVVSGILKEFGFRDRSGRYATDPANSMLNYGYGILMGEVWRAVHYAGLDPYGGFLHADKPGKPSMVLDLMEEFRPHVVDKFVFKLASKKMVSKDGFEMLDGVCLMKEETRRLFLQEFLSELQSSIRLGECKLNWSDTILRQARQIAKFLRGEVPRYEGFTQYW
ncbi:MAG: CRISPR-associated endonuclease Cas1 [Candidatus Hadarchaeum sp.]|uniref:CRISPR-associated endonuclease Cas1 n=1 Tax=Candidatus Hadarchaeum sp. TaxID=2883567 RepID=UPI003D0EB797